MTESDLKRFLGPWADAYLRYWHRHKNENGWAGAKPGFSPWPLLFGSLWFWYRKMWSWAIGLLIGAICFGAILAVLTENVGLDPWVIYVLAGLSNIVLSIFGPAIYLRHAQRTIHRIDAQNLSPIDRDAALCRLGGASIMGVMFGILSILAIFFAIWGVIDFLASLRWTAE